MEQTSLVLMPGVLDAANNLTKECKAKLVKCLSLLSKDINHPSLRPKKLKGNKRTVFECRVDQSIRLIYDMNDKNMLRCWYVGQHDMAINFGNALKTDGIRTVHVDDVKYTIIPKQLETLGSYLFNDTQIEGDTLLFSSFLEFIKLN